MKIRTTLLSLLLAGASLGAQAADDVLNLYSARHYQTDEALYGDFTKQTGIRINRIEGKEEELLERLRNEGDRSPADVLLTVDAARLAQAHELGLFAPVKSKILESRIPAHLRTDDWFAFSTRARVIVYNKLEVKPGQVSSYADLARPELKGQFCSRSGSHPYNLSLLASVIAHEGEARAEQWARGLVANFARAPKGGDTDQIKAVAAGECGVTSANTYYVARLLRSTDPALEIILVNARSQMRPSDPEAYAQANLDGGGANDAGRRSSPLPNLMRQRDGEALEKAQARTERAQLQPQVLFGPASYGVAAGAAHAAVHLLGRHRGDQSAAARVQLGAQVQNVTTHQAAGGVQQGQFAVAAALGVGPQQFQGSAGTALMVRFPIPLAEAQRCRGVPAWCCRWRRQGGSGGGRAHPFMLRAVRPGFGSGCYAMLLNCPSVCAAVVQGGSCRSQPRSCSWSGGRATLPLRLRRSSCPWRRTSAQACAAIGARPAAVICCCSCPAAAPCSPVNGCSAPMAACRCRCRPRRSR